MIKGRYSTARVSKRLIDERPRLLTRAVLYLCSNLACFNI